jgi:hypothetical protein
MYLSEDVSFCRRARRGGCEVGALLNQTVVHCGASQVSGHTCRHYGDAAVSCNTPALMTSAGVSISPLAS